MTDYREMFDKDYIGAYDLKGDTVVTIVDVQAKKIKNVQKDRDEKRPIITLDGYEKRWVCNVTNGAIIANMYSPQVEKWRGKRVTIYPTTTQAFGKIVDCIRTRPQIPDAAKTKSGDGKGLPLTDLDGAETAQHRSGTDWLAAFETATKASTRHNAGPFWDANQDAFYKVMEAARTKGETAALDRLNGAAKLLQDRMNTSAMEAG